MTPEETKRIINGLETIYRQNEKILRLLEGLSPQRLLMLQGMSEKVDVEALAKETGFTN